MKKEDFFNKEDNTQGKPDFMLCFEWDMLKCVKNNTVTSCVSRKHTAP